MTRWSDPESTEQRMLVRQLSLHPKTRDLPWFAVPNGARTSMNQAKILKAEGMRAGVPDVLLPVNGDDGKHIGLALEMKRPDGKGKVSESQKAFHKMLRDCGWRVEVCNTVERAWDCVAAYLGFPP